MNKTIKQLRALRASLPKNGKDAFGHDSSKRILLLRALRKKSIIYATEGEKQAIEEWLKFVENTKSSNEKLNEKIKKVITL